MLWWLMCIYLAVALLVLAMNYEEGDSPFRVVRDVVEALGWFVVYVPWRELSSSGRHQRLIVLSRNFSTT